MKKIKVRIPAVVAPDGRWAAYGYPSAEKDPDWAMVEEVADNGEAEFAYKRMWITAELPVPDVDEVEATAIHAEESK